MVIYTYIYFVYSIDMSMRLPFTYTYLRDVHLYIHMYVRHGPYKLMSCSVIFLSLSIKENRVKDTDAVTTYN